MSRRRDFVDTDAWSSAWNSVATIEETGRANALEEDHSMYLRFVIMQIDGDSHQRQGLFIATDTLLKSGDLSTDDHQCLQEVLAWFNRNLPVPDKAWIRGRVVFWFKEEAQECIHRMWTLGTLLRAHGKLVEVQKCAFLANIVYNDAFQVAAYAHPRDGKRTFK